MIAAVGLAMGALSTVSSLVDQAASSVSKAANPPAVDSFTPSPAAPKKAKLPAVPPHAGPPIPKFDKRAHSALLAAQEHLQHRRHV